MAQKDGYPSVQIIKLGQPSSDGTGPDQVQSLEKGVKGKRDLSWNSSGNARLKDKSTLRMF
jgi:hypothetical protein